MQSEESMLKKYGERVRSRRKELNFTLIQTIAACDKIRPNIITRRALINIEKGEAQIKQTSIVCINVLAEAFKVNPAWLAGYSDEKNVLPNENKDDNKDDNNDNKEEYVKCIELANNIYALSQKSEISSFLCSFFKLPVNARKELLPVMKRLSDMTKTKRGTVLRIIESILSFNSDDEKTLLEFLDIYRRFRRKKRIFLYHIARAMAEDL